MKKINILTGVIFFSLFIVVTIFGSRETIIIFSLMSIGAVVFIKYLKSNTKQQLMQMAYHDQLTGLANRHRLEQYINELLASSKRKNTSFGVIILDLDFFKNINDSIGHDAGDALLKIVAERLKNAVRSNDMVARIGGDEFVIVLSDIKKAEVIAQIAQKILNNILQAIMLKGREIFITISVGISLYPQDGQDIETLMKNADLALYRAKSKGRNNYQFCTPDITLKFQETADRQVEMSHGLVKDEFLLYYQPSVSMTTSSILSVEALLRWQNKKYGFVTPDSIISIAEESGLIIPLGEWILRTACKQVGLWKANGFPSLNLAINLSVRQFKSPDFIQMIMRSLKETEFSPQALILEITESLIMHDPKNAFKVLENLKKNGMVIVIDDFGTGFSSFSNLSAEYVDKIKIDKTFIHQLTDKNNVSIVSAMIVMAKKLGIKVIAEGVETKEQYDILMQEGCDEVQGYYIAKPLPTDLMESFLAARAMIVAAKS